MKISVTVILRCFHFISLYAESGWKNVVDSEQGRHNGIHWRQGRSIAEDLRPGAAAEAEDKSIAVTPYESEYQKIFIVPNQTHPYSEYTTFIYIFSNLYIILVDR